jgi:hypothetical protein
MGLCPLCMPVTVYRMTVAIALHCRTWYDSSLNCRNCRTVGLLEYCRNCRNTVGILSDNRDVTRVGPPRRNEGHRDVTRATET